MPCHFEFDKDNQVLCTVLEGKYSFSDFLSSREETQRQIVERKPFAGIWDFSEVTSYDVTPTEARQMAATPSVYPADTAQFFVAPTDYVYGMLRMFQVFSEHTRPGLRVARTRAEVHKALGIQEMKFARI